MPEISSFIFPLLTFVLTFVFLKWTQLIKIKRLPTGPYGLPFVGHLHLIGKNPPAEFMQWMKQYGSTFSIRIGRWNTVIVNGYEAIKATAENLKEAHIEKPKFLSNQISMEGISQSAKRFAHTSFGGHFDQEISVCLFTTNRLKQIEELVAKEVGLFVENMLKGCKKAPRYIQKDVKRLSAKIIYKLLYGDEKPGDIESHVDMITKATQTLEVFNENLLDFLPWLRYLKHEKVYAFREAISQVNVMISEQVNSHFKSYTKDHLRDLTDAFLATEKCEKDRTDKLCCTGQNLQKTLLDLQQKGFETLDKTLSWLILYMTKYPDIQERVHTEIDELVGRRRSIELKDKPGLVYTNAVILEVMRITSVMPFSHPCCSSRDTKIEGFDVERGTVILLNLYSIHHDKKIWGDPDIFRPERFIIEGHILDTHQINHMVPFGVGRRRCVYQFLAKINIFIAFSTIMQKCRLVCPSDENLDMEPNLGLLNSPKMHRVLVEEIF